MTVFGVVLHGFKPTRNLISPKKFRKALEKL